MIPFLKNTYFSLKDRLARLNYYQMDECALSLLSIDNCGNLPKAKWERALRDAEHQKTPILIKMQNQFYIYGNPHATELNEDGTIVNRKWEFTSINPDKALKKILNALPFERGIIKRNHLKLNDDLLVHLKSGHHPLANTFLTNLRRQLAINTIRKKESINHNIKNRTTTASIIKQCAKNLDKKVKKANSLQESLVGNLVKCNTKMEEITKEIDRHAFKFFLLSFIPMTKASEQEKKLGKYLDQAEKNFSDLMALTEKTFKCKI